MPLEPFRVRVTADGAGTLAAVHATVELVDRAEAAVDAVEPWAWYTPESIQADGGQITGWDDVTDGQRHMTEVVGSGADLTYSANVIDGNAGIVAPALAEGFNFNKNLQTPAFDWAEFADGITMFAVSWPKADPAGEVNSDWQVRALSMFDMVSGDTLQQWFGFGQLNGFDPAAAAPAVLAAWATGDGLELGFEVNGGAWQPDMAEFFQDDPWGEPWTGSTNRLGLNSSKVEGAWLCEWVVFPCALDAGQRAQWWSYFAGKYPSLFA